MVSAVFFVTTIGTKLIVKYTTFHKHTDSKEHCADRLAALYYVSSDCALVSAVFFVVLFRAGFLGSPAAASSSPAVAAGADFFLVAGFLTGSLVWAVSVISALSLIKVIAYNHQAILDAVLCYGLAHLVYLYFVLHSKALILLLYILSTGL